MEEIVVGVDVGTSKVCALIGRLNRTNQLEILGVGTEPCNGVRKGIIVDIDSTSSSIRAAIEQAESMAGLKVGSAYVNLVGAHVSVINNRISTDVGGENREITSKDIEKILYSVRNIAIPEDRQIIDVIPRQYIIDGYDEIIDPVGMVGVKLEVDADIIAGKITSVQNIVKSMEKVNVKLDGLVVEALATAEMVLTPEEKDMTTVLIDIGGGITDVSVFRNKNLIFYDSIPVGGDHITNDISLGLKIPYAEAEKVKKEYSLALVSLIKNDQEFYVSDLGDNRRKSIKVSETVEIVEARVHEIFSLVRDLLDRTVLKGNHVSGIILTGCGIIYADGCLQLAGEVFGLPVRIASGKGAGLAKNDYTTAAGIVKYILSSRKGNSMASDVRLMKQRGGKKESGILGKLTKLFYDFF